MSRLTQSWGIYSPSDEEAAEEITALLLYLGKDHCLAGWTGRLLKDPDIIYPVPPTTQIPQNRLPIPERKREERDHWIKMAGIQYTIWHDSRKCAYSHFYDESEELNANIEWSERIHGGSLVLKDTSFPISRLFECLADGENIDTISQRFQVSRDSLKSVLHAVDDSLRNRLSQVKARITSWFIGHEASQDRISRLRAIEAEKWEVIEELGPSEDEMAELRISPPQELFKEDWR